MQDIFNTFDTASNYVVTRMPNEIISSRYRNKNGPVSYWNFPRYFTINASLNYYYRFHFFYKHLRVCNQYNNIDTMYIVKLFSNIAYIIFILLIRCVYYILTNT